MLLFVSSSAAEAKVTVIADKILVIDISATPSSVTGAMSCSDTFKTYGFDVKTVKTIMYVHCDHSVTLHYLLITLFTNIDRYTTPIFRNLLFLHELHETRCAGSNLTCTPPFFYASSSSLFLPSSTHSSSSHSNSIMRCLTVL